MTNLKSYLYKNGSALLSALFIMTLVAIAATAMTTRLHLDIYRTRLTILSDKLYFASQAVTFWGINQIKVDNSPNYAIDNQATLAFYPEKYRSIYPQMDTSGRLVDLQSKLNINLLVDKKYIPIFDRLFSYVLPDKTKSDRKKLIQAIRHWINDYQPQKGQVGFLNDYLKQKPPYLPGYQVMKSISELRLIDGINAKDYLILEHFLTALPPEDFAVNVNTAPKEVLKCLGNGLTDAQVNEIIQTRTFKNNNQINKLIQKLSLPANQVSTISNYFLVIATVKHEDLNLRSLTILKRTIKKNKQVEVDLLLEQLNGQ
jgi:general secretion pathway protein K